MKPRDLQTGSCISREVYEDFVGVTWELKCQWNRFCVLSFPIDDFLKLTCSSGFWVIYPLLYLLFPASFSHSTKEGRFLSFSFTPNLTEVHCLWYKSLWGIKQKNNFLWQHIFIEYLLCAGHSSRWNKTVKSLSSWCFHSSRKRWPRSTKVSPGLLPLIKALQLSD